MERPGCLSCRARRIDCDGQKPTCGQCGGGFECLWSTAHSPPVNDRVRLACSICRLRKIRCSGPVDGDDCTRCVRLSLQCTWPGAAERKGRRPSRAVIPTPRSNTSDPQPSPSSWDALLAERSELAHHIRNYFSTVHHFGFLTFIHEPSFYQLFDRELAPRELTLMMVVTSLHFASDYTPAAMERASVIYPEVAATIQARLFQGYDAIHMMVMFLARLYEGSCGNYSASWMMCGLLVRTMQFLSLHTFDITYNTDKPVRRSPLLKPETLRRLAWAVFFMDTLADTGQHGVHLVTENSFRIQLPTTETSFVREIDVKTSDLFGGNVNIGVSGYLIRTAAMRRRILHFDSLIQYSTDPYPKILDNLSAFEADLRKVISDLPTDLAYNEHNLFVHERCLPAFMFLHLLRHNCFIMLGQARMNVCTRDSTFVEVATQVRRERLRHALAVSRIVADIMRLDVHCSPAAGVQAYTSLEIVLYDSIHLSNIDARESKYTDALSALLRYVRVHAAGDERNRLLHVESCGRLVGAGYQDLLSVSDWEKCQAVSIRSEARFNFDPLPFHRRQYGKSGYAMLDSTVRSFAPSRATSVEPPDEATDAAAVAAGPSVAPTKESTSEMENILTGTTDTLFAEMAPSAAEIPVPFDNLFRIDPEAEPIGNMDWTEWLNNLGQGETMWLRP